MHARHTWKPTDRWLLVFAAIILWACTNRPPDETAGPAPVRWTHRSSKNGDLPAPNGGTQQTASLVLDVDRDGRNDFVIAERTGSPSVAWFRRDEAGWTRLAIDTTRLKIEAGGAFYDIDGDGDLDILTKPYTWDTPRIDVWLNEGDNHP